MIITCPECQTRYRAEPKSIGPNGRTVRCANCKETWFVPAHASAEHDQLTLDKLALEDNERAEAGAFQKAKAGNGFETGSQARGADESESTAQTAAGAKAANGVFAPPIQRPGDRAPAKASEKSQHNVREAIDRTRSKRRFWNVMLIWLIPFMLLAAAAFAAFVFRHDIIKKLPQTASAYKALGIEVSAPGLAVTKPTTRYAKIDGRPVLVIEGGVKNVSNGALGVPMVALSLHNSSGERVAQWNVELTRKRLEAGESAEYISQYPNPPIDAVNLITRFADEAVGATTPIELTATDSAPETQESTDGGP